LSNDGSQNYVITVENDKKDKAIDKSQHSSSNRVEVITNTSSKEVPTSITPNSSMASM